jgi:hypothetical protein
MNLRHVVAVGLLLITCAWPRAGVTQAAAPRQSGPPAQPDAATPATSASGRLPVRRVVLYKSGIGYFEHVGRVTGDQTLGIDLTSGQLDDVLKSLTTIDLNGGQIAGITYNTEAPLAQRLSTLRLSLGESASRAALFGALRGARVEVASGGAVHSGRVLSLENRVRARADGSSTTVDEIVIVSEGGDVRTFELSPGVSVRVADADLRQQVGQYLDLMASTRAQDLRRMAIATRGTGERQVFVSYVSAVPVWKTTYRLVLPSKADSKPLLQGWAIVDNTLGEDWQNVQLSLVAGAPQSFVQRISQPYYVDRPRVELPARVSLTPQTHAGALTYGTAVVRGRIADAQGAALPGASVRAWQDDRVVAETTTNVDGDYQLSGLAPGAYRVEVALAGFAPASQFATVSAGSTTTQSFSLQVGALSESVAVQSEVPRTRGIAPRFRSGVAGGSPGGTLGGVVGGLAAAPPPSPPPTAAMAFGAVRELESAAQGGDLGDLFEYTLKQPVTIRRNQSALVPIVQSDVVVEKVSLWNASSGRPRPLRALWITNSTALTLDGGSVTLIEGDAFAGEGLIEPLKAGERRLLSYASDLAVLVDVKRDSSPQRVTRLVAARGMLRQQSEERSRATYTIRNEDAAARQVVIEHPVRGGWTLAGGVKPAESSATAHRFKVSVEPKATATLVVDESRPLENRYQISSMTSDQVAVIAKSQTADPAIEAKLGPIVAKKQAIAALERDMQEKTQELERISEGQARVRENMKALKGSDSERELIQRYTRQLGSQEDRIETLTREGAALEAQRKAAQTELDALVDALALDVVVKGD